MRRSTSGVLAALLLTLASLGSAASADPFIDEQYKASPPPVQGVPGWISGYYDDGIDDGRSGSYLYRFSGSDGQGRWAELGLCSSLDDGDCAKYKTFHFVAYLPECSDTIVTDCIVGLSAITPSGEIKGTFERQFPERGATDFTGKTEIGLPNGESPSLWRFDGLSHPGGNQFMISARVTGWVNDRDVQAQLNTSIYPVSVKTGTGPNTVTAVVGPGAGGKFVMGARDERVYLYRGDDEVLERWPFPTDVKFKLTVRVAKPLTGWLHGRVQDPEVEITSGTFGQQFTITAGPTVVPTLDKWNKFVDLPAELQAMLNAEGRTSGAFYYGVGGESDWESVTTSHQSGGDLDAKGIRKFLLFLQAADDKAAANKSSWTIRTIQANGGSTSRCLEDTSQLVGVVSTNSTVYLGGPPAFNAATQTLDYTVASPHLSRTGEPNVGQYSLIMRSTAARCVYGFKDAPFSATVSVVSADGTQQVATTTVNQKDGWLYLTASGFTYSNPTVQVKLTQPQPAKAAPIPVVQTPVVQTPTKKTITCSKGRTTKRVSGVNPKCPTGWKKK